jgi:hypothetical protein
MVNQTNYGYKHKVVPKLRTNKHFFENKACEINWSAYNAPPLNDNETKVEKLDVKKLRNLKKSS